MKLSPLFQPFSVFLTAGEAKNTQLRLFLESGHIWQNFWKAVRHPDKFYKNWPKSIRTKWPKTQVLGEQPVRV
jgi:hypothetical protein